MKRAFAAIFASLAAALSPMPASAQMPPTAEEIAGYRGLFATAHTGDVAAIEKLAAAGAAMEERNVKGRTALHIATHARQREAMQALVRFGADPRALDAQRYDAVTIAAVADDVATMRVALTIGGDPKGNHEPL